MNLPDLFDWSHAFDDVVSVELLDEDTEDGPVVFRDADGNDRIIMPQSVYHRLRGETP